MFFVIERGKKMAFHGLSGANLNRNKQCRASGIDFATSRDRSMQKWPEKMSKN